MIGIRGICGLIIIEPIEMNCPLPQILLIDDSAPTRLWISQQLGQNYHFIPQADCRCAYQHLQDQRVDVILLEQLLPDISGLEFVQQLQSQPNFSTIPSIMLTRDQDSGLILDAFRAGCWDFMRKPLDIYELHARIEKAIERKILSTQMQRSLRELKQRADRDPLTGLLNRQALFEASEKEVIKSRRTGCDLSLLLIDIDQFKGINDSYGHIAGDHLLKQFASLLTGMTRAYDIVGRYGGDEFILVLPSVGKKHAALVGEKIIDSVVERGFHLRGRKVPGSTSIGIASYGQLDEDQRSCGRELFALIDCADKALYRAKAEGRCRLAFEESSVDYEVY